MNTIEEILKFKKNQCSNCKNKNNKNDLCSITRTIDNAYKCVNYEKCMKNKCKTCKDSERCNDEYKENRKDN